MKYFSNPFKAMSCGDRKSRSSISLDDECGSNQFKPQMVFRVVSYYQQTEQDPIERIPTL